MSQMDPEFMKVLASCMEAEGEVDYTDDRWMPPIGDYTCLLEAFKTGTKKRDGVTYFWAKPVFRILTGEYKRRSFGDFYWFSPDRKENSMTMWKFNKLVRCISGCRPKTEEESIAILRKAEGNVAVRLRMEKSKKTAKTYVRYLSRIEAQ